MKKHTVRVLDTTGYEVNHLYDIESTEDGFKLSLKNEYKMDLPKDSEFIGTGLDIDLSHKKKTTRTNCPDCKGTGKETGGTCLTCCGLKYITKE